MVVEDQRVLHEDIERLESAVADRVMEEPKNVRFSSSFKDKKLTWLRYVIS